MPALLAETAAGILQENGSGVVLLEQTITGEGVSLKDGQTETVTSDGITEEVTPSA